MAASTVHQANVDIPRFNYDDYKKLVKSPALNLLSTVKELADKLPATTWPQLVFYPITPTQELLTALNETRGEWVIPRIATGHCINTVNAILEKWRTTESLVIFEESLGVLQDKIPTLKIPPNIRQLTFHNGYGIFELPTSNELITKLDTCQAHNLNIQYVVDITKIAEQFTNANLKRNGFMLPVNHVQSMSVRFYGSIHAFPKIYWPMVHPYQMQTLRAILSDLNNISASYNIFDFPYSLEPHKQLNAKHYIDRASKVDYFPLVALIADGIETIYKKKLSNPDNLMQHPKLQRYYTYPHTILDMLSKTITKGNLENNPVVKALVDQRFIDTQDLTTLTEDQLQNKLFEIANNLSNAGKAIVLKTMEHRMVLWHTFYRIQVEIQDIVPPHQPNTELNT